LLTSSNSPSSITRSAFALISAAFFQISSNSPFTLAAHCASSDWGHARCCRRLRCSRTWKNWECSLLGKNLWNRSTATHNGFSDLATACCLALLGCPRHVRCVLSWACLQCFRMPSRVCRMAWHTWHLNPSLYTRNCGISSGGTDGPRRA
jgi:hypothetical protein